MHKMCYYCGGNYGLSMRKQGICLEKEIMQGTMPGSAGARRRGRPRTAWMDSIKTWTGLSVEESIRMTEDSDKWRKYVHGVANPRMDRGRLKNRTEVTRSVLEVNRVSVLVLVSVLTETLYFSGVSVSAEPLEWS